MWGRRRRRLGRVDTLLGPGTRLEGDLHFRGGLHVAGRIRGNVRAEEGREAALVLAPGGRIEGDVEAPRVLIQGTVTGEVRSGGWVELAPGAKVHGDIYYRHIEMALGAEVNGRLVRIDAQPAPSLPAPGAERGQQEVDRAAWNTHNPSRDEPSDR